MFIYLKGGDGDDDDEYDIDDGEGDEGDGIFSKITSNITPISTFIVSSVIFLIMYICYNKFYLKTSISYSYICCAISGILICTLILKLIYLNFFRWFMSIIFISGMALFYKLFLL
jgi:hypothetical protein